MKWCSSLKNFGYNFWFSFGVLHMHLNLGLGLGLVLGLRLGLYTEQRFDRSLQKTVCISCAQVSKS